MSAQSVPPHGPPVQRGAAPPARWVVGSFGSRVPSEPSAHRPTEETVRHVMTPRPCACTPEDTVAAAARRMVLCQCGGLPVVDRARSRRLVGIVTDGDILRRVVAANLDPSSTPVRLAMSGEVATLTPYATLEECAGLMAAQHVGRVPIVDNTGTLLGIVARADLERGSDAPQEVPVEEDDEALTEPAPAS